MYTVLQFKKITPNDFEWVGKKVSSLVPLAGIVSVPSGFVITKAMFEKYIDDLGMLPKIKILISQIEPSNKEQLQSVANEIQRMIVSRDMPENMKEEILDYYHTMNMDEHIPISELLENQEQPNVAVRASPIIPSNNSETLEQSIQVEGVYMNFLNISGEERLMKAIQSCWASLFTAKAIEERLKNKVNHASIAVFIQRMIDAERSGVVYSTHPQNEEAVLIHGCYGLGEAISLHMITPDEYSVRKDTYEVIEIKPQRQEFKLIRDMEKGKTVKVDLPEPHNTHQKLNEKHLINVAKTAKKIEKHLCKAQKVEFALCGEEVYILGTNDIILEQKQQPQFENSALHS